MKKNYIYPKTEEVLLEGCNIMQDVPNSKTPMVGPDGKVGPWGAPKRQL